MFDSFVDLRIVVSADATGRARRHAAELTRMGFQVHLHANPAAPGADPLASRRPDAQGAAVFMRLVDTFKPDVLYDLHGPLCVVHAAAIRSVPVVSLAGPDDWSCAPGTLAERALKPLARAAHIAVPRWEAMRESRDYACFVRDAVSLFVARDAGARAGFAAQGVPASRVVECGGDEERVARQVGELLGALAGRGVYADAAD